MTKQIDVIDGEFSEVNDSPTPVKDENKTAYVTYGDVDKFADTELLEAVIKVELPDGSTTLIDGIETRKMWSNGAVKHILILKASKEAVVRNNGAPTLPAPTEKPIKRINWVKKTAEMLEELGLTEKDLYKNMDLPEELLELPVNHRYRLFYGFQYDDRTRHEFGPLPPKWKKNDSGTPWDNSIPIHVEDIEDWSIYDSKNPPPRWILNDMPDFEERYWRCFKAKLSSHIKKGRNSVKLLPKTWHVEGKKNVY